MAITYKGIYDYGITEENFERIYNNRKNKNQSKIISETNIDSHEIYSVVGLFNNDVFIKSLTVGPKNNDVYVSVKKISINEDDCVMFESKNIGISNMYMEYNDYLHMIYYFIKNYIIDINSINLETIQSNIICLSSNTLFGYKLYHVPSEKYTQFKPIFCGKKLTYIGLDDTLVRIAKDNFNKYTIDCRLKELKELTTKFLNEQKTCDNIEQFRNILDL